MEVGSEVKGFPKHVCEGSKVNHLNVDMMGKERKRNRRGQIICCHLDSVFGKS